MATKHFFLYHSFGGKSHGNDDSNGKGTRRINNHHHHNHHNPNYCHHPPPRSLCQKIWRGTRQKLWLPYSPPHPPPANIVLLLREPLGRPDPQALTPEQKGNDKHAEEAHEHTEDAKRLGRPSLGDPLAHEEGPRKGDDGSRGGDHDEAVSSQGTIRIDEVVEADRRHLHEAKHDRAKAELKADPPQFRRVLRHDPKDDGA